MINHNLEVDNMPRSILVVNIAWNSSQWKCPNINDFHNRHRYGFPFVRTVGFGYEGWNFDDVPNGKLSKLE